MLQLVPKSWISCMCPAIPNSDIEACPSSFLLPFFMRGHVASNPNIVSVISEQVRDYDRDAGMLKRF